MRKVAIAFSTKDRVELTKQTWAAFTRSVNAKEHGGPDIFWMDGSSDGEAREFFATNKFARNSYPDVRGGADAAIVFALTKMLEGDYDIVGLCENDVLLRDGWFEQTMALFEKGDADGLKVGAVSPRCYEDRILIQRDGYAVMHNLGAGIVLFSREAAQLVLANYRTGWWNDNRAIFAQLSGLDIGRWAAFRGNAQWTTADWFFDAVLAQGGLASLATTPSLCDMVGQQPSLEEQGLALARGPRPGRDNPNAFVAFCNATRAIRAGEWRPDTICAVHRYGGMQTIFAHQHKFAGALRTGNWRLQWSQGFGPFAYRAETESSIRLLLFGPVTFLVSGGKHGAKVTIVDTESGYEIKPDLPAGEMQIAQLQVPGGMSYRELVLTCSAGAVFYGVQTVEPQPIVNSKFDYHSLPPV